MLSSINVFAKIRKRTKLWQIKKEIRTQKKLVRFKAHLAENNFAKIFHQKVVRDLNENRSAIYDLFRSKFSNQNPFHLAEKIYQEVLAGIRVDLELSENEAELFCEIIKRKVLEFKLSRSEVEWDELYVKLRDANLKLHQLANEANKLDQKIKVIGVLKIQKLKEDLATAEERKQQNTLAAEHLREEFATLSRQSNVARQCLAQVLTKSK